MKKIVIVLFLLVPGILSAQKEVKPNINKAMTALTSGKFDEAKSTIDAATTYEKTMNDGKTWFYRGVIYGALDTTASYKSTEDLTAVSAASFQKAREISGGKTSSYFVTTSASPLPLAFDQAITDIANRYLVKGGKLFGEEDYKGALVQFEKGIAFKPDTTFYLYAGYSAYNAEERKKSIDYLTQYAKQGGREQQALTMPALIAYEDQTYEESLVAARDVLKILPGHKDMKAIELNSLIQLKKYDDAATLLASDLKANPNDAQGHYLLGVLNTELKKEADAKKNFEDAVRIDPNHYEASLALARIYYFDAKVIKDEMNALGISAADKKKRLELDSKYLEKLKIALPYWQKLEKIKPDSQDVLDGLYTIYGDLDNQEQLKRLEKRYKELGIE
ncbi:MAG TPA: tetratricopeptide repeat protein [Ohtaekwangia sp.]